MGGGNWHMLEYYQMALAVHYLHMAPLISYLPKVVLPDKTDNQNKKMAATGQRVFHTSKRRIEMLI
jgi:hypothetical protein